MSSLNGKEKLPWVNQYEHGVDSLRYIHKRRTKQITSLITPWRAINNSSINGFEPNTITVFAGRPANGKTLMADQLSRMAHELNPLLNLKILQYQFEMLGRNTKLRELTSYTKKSYKELCSADSKLSDKDFDLCKEYIEKTKDKEIDIIDKAKTVDEFKAITRQYMEAHSFEKEVAVKGSGKKMKKFYRNTLITLDHSGLLRLSKTNKDKKDMLYDFGEAMTELKKEYPIWFVILSQLNREIEKPERQKEGTYGNYVLESDLFAADALMQHADNIYGITIPAKRFIHLYGPEQFIIEDETTIAVHIIKSRSGKTGVLFLKGDYANMAFTDMDTPGQKPIKKERVPLVHQS